MKNYYVGVMMIVLMAMPLWSQKDKGDFEYGFQAGLSISNVSTIDNQTSAGTRVGFNVGAYGEYFFSESWGVKARLLYDQKGWADGFFNNLDTGQSVITDYVLNYLSIPVMANWHFGRNKNWYFNFGPYAGFLLSANLTEVDMDVDDAFNSTDFGLTFGVGVKIEISDRNHLFIEFDNQSGFTDIFEQNSGDAIRNGRSSINVGISF